MIDFMRITRSRTGAVSRVRLALLGVFFSLLIAHGAAAQDLTIAAASDLQGALPEVISRYQQQTGRNVRATFGSSGNFFAQIQNGAPFDLFFSADIDYPRQLETRGLAEPGTLVEYAVGSLVLWAPKGGVDLTPGLALLISPAIRKIAIANPEHAPYGRAAVAAMRAAGVYDQVRTKLVLGENISQAAQFVQSGNAEIGIIARSIALLPALAASGNSVAVAPETYPPIEQGAVVVKASTRKDVARDFLQFVNRPEIASLMQRFGFTRPAPPSRR